MAKKKTRIVAPVKPLKAQEVSYRRELNQLGKALIKSIREEVLPVMKAQEESYVLDGVSDTIETILTQLRARFSGTLVATFAKVTSENMVQGVAKSSDQRFNRTVGRAVGVSLTNIASSEGLEDFISGSVNRNVSLITSLSEEYFKDIETIVTNGITSGARYSTIAKQIVGRTGTTNSKLISRIGTIARNEVQTVNAQINVRRSSGLGITEGIYRTSGDEVVRPCHAELNGDRFELAKGAWSSKCQKWIQPGITDINCRCSYSPVVEIEEVAQSA